MGQNKVIERERERGCAPDESMTGHHHSQSSTTGCQRRQVAPLFLGNVVEEPDVTAFGFLLHIFGRDSFLKDLCPKEILADQLTFPFFYGGYRISEERAIHYIERSLQQHPFF